MRSIKGWGKNIFFASYQNLNLIEINKTNLLSNFFALQSLNKTSKICPVLKSNAYGHGLGQIAKILDKEIGPEFLCVDSLFEAYELEKLGIRSKILILGYTMPKNYSFREIDFHLPLFDTETLYCLNKYQASARVHLKIDTGMNRMGIKENQIDFFIKQLKKFPKVKVEGIYSHLATADSNNNKYAIAQINKFKQIVKYFESKGFCFRYKHINATAGFIKFQDPFFNISRIGLGIYGISPFSPRNKYNKALNKIIKPVLKLKSHIVEIKTLCKGETVSYGQTFTAKKKTVIGVIAVGYADGVDRRLSNKGSVLVKNSLCPVVGRICMNVFMIDITNIPNVKTGQEVIVFDNNNENDNSIYNCAYKMNTIPHELLAMLNPTIKRIIT